MSQESSEEKPYNKQNFDKTSIIKEILLNKVKGLNWYYFKLDLNKSLDNIADKGLIYNKDDDFFENFNVGENGRVEIINTEIKKTSSFKDPIVVLRNIFTITDCNPEIFKEIAQRIFDKKDIPNKSDADQGLLGKYNEKDRAYRNSIFHHKIRNGFRRNPKNKVILAEGDSWFQFPRIFLGIDAVKDIIDHLIEKDKYAINSLAYGGDWLSNILSLSEYIEELTLFSPDVFLISGGGNDMVGSSRIATMVKKADVENDLLEQSEINARIKESKVYSALVELRRNQASKDKRIQKREIFDEKKYKKGLIFIEDEFFQFINVIMVQYFLFMYNITKSGKYTNMKIITQGYDFAVPRHDNEPKKRFFNKLINAANDNGNWLDVPLKMKGIINDDLQEAVIYVMIYEFNEMLIQLANVNLFKNVYHIDNRGLANYKNNEWFDELHLQSKIFNKVANLYEMCIDAENGSTQKVYSKLDLIRYGDKAHK